MAALLHDVIEDTGVPKHLSKEFDEDVANLVDGVSKLKSIFIVAPKLRQKISKR